MKTSSTIFLSRANLKGNRKRKVVIALSALLIISSTLITCFSHALSREYELYKQDYRTRTLELPGCDIYDAEIEDKISKLDHVTGVYHMKSDFMPPLGLLSVTDENGNEDIKIKKHLEQNRKKEEDCDVNVMTLIGDEKRDVIAGETLDNAPVFSCIVPHLFYPFGDFQQYVNNDAGFEYKNDLDYIDGESLIGKTLTVKPMLKDDDGEYYYEYSYYIEGIENNEGGLKHLKSLEYKLKVVGTYFVDPIIGDMTGIYVSDETGTEIVRQAMKATGINPDKTDSEVNKYFNNPYLQYLYIVVDDYENMGAVKQAANSLENDLGESILIDELRIPNEAFIKMVTILNAAGNFFIFATLILCVINLIQSSANSLRTRKGEIGLLKAIGYKTLQIFRTLFAEQLILTFRGMLLGGAISAAVIALANRRNLHATFDDRIYVVSWQDYLVYLLLSAAVIIIVPTICQLVGIKRLAKIQPREAMG